MKKTLFAESVEHFLTHGRIYRDYKQATVDGYRTALNLFQASTGIIYLQSASPELVENFLFEGRVTRNWSVCTFRTYHKQLRAFFNWCLKKGLIEANHTDGIEKPPVEKKLPKFLTIEQSNLLLDTAFHSRYHYKKEGYRNRAVIGIMLLAGLRLAEIGRLKSIHVNLDDAVLFIADGKWGKDRRIPINARLRHILADYEHSKTKQQKACHQFFTGMQGDYPLGKRGVQLICKKLKQETGIIFSPQTLRHTFATHAYEGSKDIYAVSGLLGHSKVETTQIYAHLSLESKRSGVDQSLLNTI